MFWRIIIRRVLPVALVFSFGWIAYFWLVNVNLKDVTMAQKLDRHVGAEPFRAGDLVEVSADNQRLSHLCPMNVPVGDLEEFQHNARYVNGLSQSLSGFSGLIGWAKSLFGAEESETLAEAKPLEIRFNGKLSSIAATAEPPLNQDCFCKIAEAMMRRSKICTVQKSMIATELVRSVPTDPNSPRVLDERTVGVTFKPNSMVVPDQALVQCPSFNRDAILPGAQSCLGAPGYPPDVRVRDWLGVIREVKL